MATLRELASPELIASIQGAAQADGAFAHAFLCDPKGVYRQRFGSELLPGHDVKVGTMADGAIVVSVAGIPEVFYVNLSTTDELSDRELEYVSAGRASGRHRPRAYPPAVTASFTTGALQRPRKDQLMTPLGDLALPELVASIQSAAPRRVKTL